MWSEMNENMVNLKDSNIKMISHNRLLKAFCILFMERSRKIDVN